MKRLKFVFYSLWVFVSGGMVFVNLDKLYIHNTVYEASLGKILFFILVAIFASMRLYYIPGDKDE